MNYEDLCSCLIFIPQNKFAVTFHTPNQFLRSFHEYCFSVFQFLRLNFLSVEAFFLVHQFSRPIISLTLYVKVQKQPPEVFYKKVFFKVSQNWQETPVPESLIQS